MHLRSYLHLSSISRSVPVPKAKLYIISPKRLYGLYGGLPPLSVPYLISYLFQSYYKPLIHTASLKKYQFFEIASHHCRSNLQKS